MDMLWLWRTGGGTLTSVFFRPFTRFFSLLVFLQGYFAIVSMSRASQRLRVSLPRQREREAASPQLEAQVLAIPSVRRQLVQIGALGELMHTFLENHILRHIDARDRRTPRRLCGNL